MESDNLELLASELYDRIKQSHIKAAWLDVYHIQQRDAWVAAGKPVRFETRSNRKLADGYDVLTWMQQGDLDDCIKQARRYLDYLGMSSCATVQIDFHTYQRLTRYL